MKRTPYQRDDVIDGPLVGAETLARCLGISKPTLYKHTRCGRIRKIAPNCFALTKSVQSYCTYLRSRLATLESMEGMSATLTARAKKEKAQAEILQLKAEKMRSELICVAEAEKVWTGIAKRIRSSCMALVPTLVVEAALTEAQGEAARKTMREILGVLSD